MMAATPKRKRGRPQQPGLLRHKRWGYYKRYDGKPKYFGHDPAEAHQRWLEHERQLVYGPVIDSTSNLVANHQEVLATLQAIANRDDALELKDATRRLLQLITPTTTEPQPQQQQATSSIGPKIADACDAYQKWMQVAGKKPNSIRDVKYSFNHFENFVGNKPIASLTRQDFISWRDSLYLELQTREQAIKQLPQMPTSQKELRKLPGKSSANISQLLANIRAGFRRCKQELGWQYPERDWLDLLQVKSGTQLEGKYFTQDEWQKLWKASNTQWRTILLVALNMAASNIDIAELSWKHIDFDSGLLSFDRGKQLGIRRLKLWPRTLKALAIWRKQSHSNLVFTTKTGVALKTPQNNSDTIGDRFSKLATAAGVQGTFKAIRKTAATAAANAGTEPQFVEMLLGDAPKAIWRKYAMICPQQLTGALAAIEAEYFKNIK